MEQSAYEYYDIKNALFYHCLAGTPSWHDSDIPKITHPRQNLFFVFWPASRAIKNVKSLALLLQLLYIRNGQFTCAMMTGYLAR
jgi:hypothetical protein